MICPGKPVIGGGLRKPAPASAKYRASKADFLGGSLHGRSHLGAVTPTAGRQPNGRRHLPPAGCDHVGTSLKCSQAGPAGSSSMSRDRFGAAARSRSGRISRGGIIWSAGWLGQPDLPALGGNPLFMVTALDDMAARGLISRNKGCWQLGV